MESTHTTPQLLRDGNDQPYLNLTTTTTKIDTNATNYTEAQVDEKIAGYQALTAEWQSRKALFHQ